MLTPSTLIISAKSGQLGNRLFTSAHYMAFACSYHYRLFNPSFDEYAPYFEGTYNNPLVAFPKPAISLPTTPWLHQHLYHLNRKLCKSGRFNVVNIERGKAFSLNDSSFRTQLQSRTLNFIQGWLFREGWFMEDRELLASHAAMIKAYFSPRKLYRDRVSHYMAQLRHQHSLVIGVHVRQGDYQTFKSGRYFYPFSHYAECIRALAQQLGDRKVCFLICSNVAQDLSDLADVNVAAGTGNLIEDMYLLAGCDYILGPPSSYSMWASFYGDVPLYMLRDVAVVPRLEDFVGFYEWTGRFNAHEDWSQSTWDWLSQRELALQAQ